ncbi:hypothetical protein ACHAW6_015259 [Cyclotella cf. meneghiniana]
MINSVLSRKGAWFCTFDIFNFYLCIPLDRSEYIKIKLSDILQEFIDKYNLMQHVHNDWIFFEIWQGIYGLPQAGILAQKLLAKHLATNSYYQCECTPGLWCHKWQPIMFTLIVDDFGIEYGGEEHSIHLHDTIKAHYDITENWQGNLYSGINLHWDYIKHNCHLTMHNYIDTVLTKYNHSPPRKPVISPFKATPITFGVKVQHTLDPDSTPPLNAASIKQVQGIVGTLLYSAHSVDNKLLHALSKIGIQQATATIFSITVPHIHTMASSTKPAPWSLQPTPMWPTSMSARGAAEQGPTSCYPKTSQSPPSMDPFSHYHKSSSLSPPLLQKPNL